MCFFSSFYFQYTQISPVTISFGSIIYQDPFFQPYLPILMKLTLISCIVHQYCFATLSSLPFAVGQVQDAGLIFLSSMATSIVQYCQENDYTDPDTILATVTIGLGVATTLLGIGLVLVGKLRLAQYVQMLPTPVVGGYLAYIGWFCGIAGLHLMAPSKLSWSMIIQHGQWIYLLPGICGGCFIYGLVRNLRHMAVVPTCVVMLLVAFYGGLALSGHSVEEATAHGWITDAAPAPVWYHTWDFLQFDKVIWSALPPQIGTLLGMIFVVSISSSLDVAAIELDMRKPLDYNKELSMVGVSNVISGLTGGYTGSYIFSQTIFNLRAGIRSRLCGFVIGSTQLLFFLIPYPVLSYVPNFFFGSLLIMIAVDLVIEWLWDVRAKLTVASYAVCVGTFMLIQITNVELGIVLGIVLYGVCSKLLKLDMGAFSSDDDTSSTGEDDDDDEEEALLEGDENKRNNYGNYGATESS